MQKKEGRVLVVDDDEYIGLSLKLLLDQHFERVTTQQNPEEIPDALEEGYDVIILDMNFRQGETSGQEGLHWLTKINSLKPEVSVVLLTAYGEVNTAVNAMKGGAVDFIVKPWQNDKLLATVMSAARLHREKKRVTHLQTQQKMLSSVMETYFGEMIGESAAMKKVFQILEKVAPTPADILILGENGTGKEVAARAIHKNSSRRDEIFISVDLGAIHENLFESELFGHKKGAFTDAREDRIGRFEAAHGGTLFLDEIGNLPLPLQAKLLTVLERREIIRVGTNHPIPFDVRIICATNSHLKEMIRQGQFREDLLYRINTVELQMPPLRERLEDIPLLLQQMLNTFGRKYQRGPLEISSDVLKLLNTYHWPGNIRELQHAVERAVIMSEGDILHENDFSFLLAKKEDQPGLNDYNLENLEAWAIQKAIRKHEGNISHAAMELGLSRGAMYRRMEKYKLQ
jgi:two-component system, NtrC family, response regulator HydG